MPSLHQDRKEVLDSETIILLHYSGRNGIMVLDLNLHAMFSHPYARLMRAVFLVEVVVLLMGAAIFISCTTPAASVETVCPDNTVCINIR